MTSRLEKWRGAWRDLVDSLTKIKGSDALLEIGMFIIGASIVPLFSNTIRILAIILMIGGSIMVHSGVEPFLRKRNEISIKFLLGLYIGGVLFGLLITIGIGIEF